MIWNLNQSKMKIETISFCNFNTFTVHIRKNPYQYKETPIYFIFFSQNRRQAALIWTLKSISSYPSMSLPPNFNLFITSSSLDLIKQIVRNPNHIGNVPSIQNEEWYPLLPNFSIQNNDLFLFNKKVIPLEEVENSLVDLYYHQALGTSSRDSLYAVVKNQFWGISRRNVDAFLKKQKSYQLHKRSPTKKKMVSYTASIISPNQVWQIDIGELPISYGKKYFLAVIDLFSGFLWAFPLRDKSSSEVLTHLDSIFQLGNIPKKITSDNGKEFIGITKDLQERGILHFTSLPHNPKSQGKIERAIGTTKRKLAILLAKLQKSWAFWSLYLNDVVDSINNSPSIGGVSPRNAFFSSSSHQKILKKRSRQIFEQWKINQKGEKFQIGDFVRIYRGAFDNDYKRKKIQCSQKSYLENYSREIYQIVEMDHLHTTGTMKAWFLKKLNDNSIIPYNLSTFEKDLQKITHVNFYDGYQYFDNRFT